MAESKTQGRGTRTTKGAKATTAPKAKEPAKAGKAGGATSRAGKATAKPAKSTAKAAKPPAKKASAKTAKAPAKGAKVPAKSASEPAARATKRSGRTAAKDAAKPRKVSARAARDAATDAPSAPAPAAPEAATVTPATALSPDAATPAPAAPAAATPPASPRAPRPPAKRKVVQETARSYFDALASRDAATVAAHWHREGIYDSVPLGVFRGPDAVRRVYQEMFTAIPDMRTIVDRITADDRVAAVQWRASGTFSGGPLRGVEPTGRQIEVRGIDSLEIEDGKILRTTSVYDGTAVARGMGLLPAEDSGADRAIRTGLNTVTKLRRAMAARTGGDG